MDKSCFKGLLTSFLLMFGSACWGVGLPNGGKLAGEISFVGEVDEYTFAASAGETVYIRVADTETTQFVSSAFTPLITLLSPTGAVIETGRGVLVAAIAESLVVSGTFRVLVRDDSGGADETGTYDIYYAKAPGANDDGMLPNGGMLSERIDLGDIDSYTFAASAGETIYLRVADTETTQFVGSTFTPEVTLLNPSGVPIRSGRGVLVAAITESLVVSGTYTVIVRDDSGGLDSVGSYNIYYAKAPGAKADGVLPNGGKLSGEIDLGDIDSYTFSANDGETIYIRVADTETTQFVNSAFTPEVTLLNPSGVVIEGDSGVLVASIDQVLSESGAYTVIVRDDSGGLDAEGSYDIYFAKAPGANNDGCIAATGSANGFIDLGDLDSFQFVATAGTFITVTASDLDVSTFTPEIILLDTSGAPLVSDRGVTTAQFTRTLTQTGTYTLILRDDSGGFDATGNYQLSISGAGLGCPTALCNGLPVTVFIGNGDTPTAGADVILGTFGADTIVALGGNDTICALAGNDIINAGPGDDWVQAGNGDDTVFGLAGDDIVFGGNGADEIIAGAGNDLIIGNGNADTLNAGPGNDTVFGGTGNDDIFGQDGNDLLYGGDGADFIIGVAGADQIHGGTGDDILNGGNGNDVVYGEAGADTVFGLGGADSLNGGPGNDMVFGQLGSDNVRGGGGNDQLFGNEDNDVIKATSGTNVINGGPGSDRISGGSGDDDIFGDGNLLQAGNDIIEGGAGMDLILGFSGNDTIDASDGVADVANGGPGVDVCSGDAVDLVFNCP